MKDNMIERSVRVLAAASVLIAAGCGAETDVPDNDDAVSVRTSAFGESCGDAPGGLQFDGGANVFIYPYSEGGCYKGVRVTITNYSSAYLGDGAIPGGTDVIWADARAQGGPGLPTSEAACNRLWTAAYLYRFSGAGWLTKSYKESRGYWHSAGGDCWPPKVSFTSDEIFAGSTYRFAVTARMDATSGAAIAGVKVVSHRPTQVH